jgi:hypothetical protein
VMVARGRAVDRAAGVLLLAGAFANFAGAIMFSIRGGPSEMAEELFPSWGSGADDRDNYRRSDTLKRTGRTSCQSSQPSSAVRVSCDWSDVLQNRRPAAIRRQYAVIIVAP